VTFAPDHLVTNAASIPELRMDASANSLLLLVPFLNTLLEFRSDRLSMIRKSGNRFSEKDHAQTKR